MTTSRRVVAPFVALIMALSALIVPATAPAAAQQAETYFVPETRQLIGEPFLSTWLALGGPARIGLPVSTVDEPGAATTQYFERGALRLGEDGDVAALPVGRAILDRPDPSDPLRTGRRAPAPRDTRPFTALRGAPSGDAVVYDAETGHAVKGAMRAAYEATGGAEMLGAPLSEAYVSGSTRVQWFEMGRLEDRGDAVAAGPVGAELAVLDGVDRSPRSQGALATFDLPTVLAARDGDAGDRAGDAGPSFSPARIAIPAIGVDAFIEGIGISGGVMGVPSNPWNVGWYSGLGGPGGPGGNTVMAGHKDWAGIGPVVFYGLAALGAGNEIYLYDGAGNAATYIVYETFAVGAYADSGGVIGDQGGDTLTLITCGGSFDGAMYDLRVIVRASRAA